ncbi:RDD family protein [Candidatus Methylacidithermus pantelleriae]|uniref:Putative Transporter n=1 Tax=Candidatus Methylacidithermus pantelleriae TaxID=2744239 RepID=A0A8J2BRX9_9BACT|nr:RDD family protein [Candidatus Methylacidithermus pantelleriae]CAF0702610.1 putative Transporter [Candidatus Methylacidithermus pantelleriae]
MGEEETPPQTGELGAEIPSRFYLAKEGQRHGPFSLEEAKKRLQEALFGADDLAWYPGSPGWKRIAEIPWLAEAVVLETPPPAPAKAAGGPPPGVKLASRLSRFAAGVLDLALVSIAARLAEPDLGSDPAVSNFLFLFYLTMLLLLLWVYSTVAESSSYQATLGKWLLGLKVINTKGDRLSLGQAAMRSLGKLLSLVLVGLGFIPILFTPNRQGLPDWLARSYVVEEKRP